MKVDITVVLLDGTKHKRHLHTLGHRRLTQAGIKQVLEAEADRIEKFFPGQEFRLVPLRGCSFNFVEVKPGLEIKPEVIAETQRRGEARC